ncbi:Permeases of the drug/metabolite transporter (DMT) superfamily [Methylophaga thiooxydans]|uniref:Permeases of the drug/metabolite transporter (DMT) superfamily n=1 Tax=Methylophaga thiooxydans TaxID=392484 RepID=A0A0A0BI51_9GAMM|nr:DMT family transporter [Methylophaga thiooxydans]KGM07357.1 Permeases of the drug/metabolite transporter (DMT) superfamily [Methylophaga thiooxydans]
MEVFVVLGRLLFSAFSNVFQKQLTHRGLHPFFIVFASYLVLAIICLPLLWTFNPFELSTRFWINIFFAALLDMAGTLFLVMSLSRTDLSVFGPLNAYKVVISMLLAMLFIGEIPSLQGFLGVCVIVAGSYFLFPPKSHQGRMWHLFTEKGVQFRFLSILLFSIGTLPLKNAVIAGGALPTTVFWCLIGLPLAGVAQLIFVRDNFRDDLVLAKNQFYPLLYLGCLIFLMQYMTMLVFSQLLVAYSLALFQLSMVLQVFLGYRIFNEKHIFRRLAACLVMVGGSLMVLNA